MLKAIANPIVDINPGRLLNAAAKTVVLWQERAEQRYRLAALDDHILADIGLSRADAVAESEKPFWRA